MTIRKSLPHTKEATFSIDLPNPDMRDMPTPHGTGFFVSSDGWFVTAAHVVKPKGGPALDVSKGWLKGVPDAGPPTRMLRGMSLEVIDERTDFALLKVDLAANATRDWMEGRSDFPHLTVSLRTLDEGEPVYAFGYPLPEAGLRIDTEAVRVGTASYRPRVTSAIVSALRYEYGAVVSGADVAEYVLDKALNYGNSGGPILATDTGRVQAFCSRFQPVHIPQSSGPVVMVPSLYGISVRLSNPSIAQALRERGVPLSEN